VASELAERWQLPKPKQKFNGVISKGRTGPGGPRVALLQPRTYMNESGTSAGPARGSLKVPLDRVVVVHDEIDLPFGEIQPRLGGGLAGHNGLKSLKRGFGDAEFWRVTGSAASASRRPRSKGSSTRPPRRPSAWSSG
jgi:PTH1 family peptidyl-tRNA hydrolase